MKDNYSEYDVVETLNMLVESGQNINFPVLRIIETRYPKWIDAFKVVCDCFKKGYIAFDTNKHEFVTVKGYDFLKQKTPQ